MANYSTQAVLSSAPLKDVPAHVYRALSALAHTDIDALKELFYELNDGGALRASLAKYGILADVNKLPADELLADYENESQNTVKGNIILDDSGNVIMGPGQQPVLYTDELAREYLVDLVRFADDDIETACGEMTVTRYQDGDEDDGVYIHWEESLSDGAEPVMQWLLSHLPEEVKFLRIDAANTASKPLTDAYGGFCAVFTRDDAWWLHASTEAARIERVIEGKVIPVTRILNDILGEDWSDRQTLGALSAFIEQRGLDGELRRYLVDLLQENENLLTSVGGEDD